MPRSHALRRTASVIRSRADQALLTLAVAIGALGLAPTAPTAPGVSLGRVCVFLAPEGADLDSVDGLFIGHHHAGHVGWAYRWSDGTRWDFGATENGRQHWNASGTEAEMLRTFTARRNPNGNPGPYYTRYRCADTRGARQHEAFLDRARLDRQTYHLIGVPWPGPDTDNCLTRAIRILKAYDGPGPLSHLASARLHDFSLTWPNSYFATDLPGFGPAAALT